MIWVTHAEYVGDYFVRLRFSDGIQRVVNLRDTIFKDNRAIFADLQDPATFQRFRVDIDTLVWDNGLDLAPEYLYSLPASSSGYRDEGGQRPAGERQG
jgi:hypothetical protein